MNFQDYEIEQKQIIRCAEWLLSFLTQAKPRRVVSGEAIKRGFSKSQLKAARQMLHVELIQQGPAGEDYWYLDRGGEAR